MKIIETVPEVTLKASEIFLGPTVFSSSLNKVLLLVKEPDLQQFNPIHHGGETVAAPPTIFFKMLLKTLYKRVPILSDF